jgi:excisionase family DNA binding protein
MASPLTTDQAAESLGVTRSRIIAMINAGRLKASKFGTQWVIDQKDLAKVRNRKPGRPKKKG